MQDDNAAAAVSVPDHKLCGYLCAVLTAPSSQTLPLHTLCHVNQPEPGFLAENGVVLSPINRAPAAADSPSLESGAAERESATPPPSSSRKKRRRFGRVPGSATTPSSLSGKKARRFGLVQGSASVVHQVHALVGHKCLKVVGRVLRVDRDFMNGVRVVVLVDVYLPIAVWSGWQFPKMGSVAAALFRHLSCDWQKRSSMLLSERIDCGPHSTDIKSIWNVSDCHVLGCKLQCGVPDTSRRKLFELHEIFKSLPSVATRGNVYSSRVHPADASCSSGIWEVSDDQLIVILNSLSPIDLVRVSATCRHLRSLAVSVMPCMKLKLFPHQQGAVEWMLQRERDPELLPHPLYMNFVTEDGFGFYMNTVSGETVTGSVPSVRDFRGGMFCDEPGLGKTITALSLILKTQGTMAEPPNGAHVIWCAHNADYKCGYYEVTGGNAANGSILLSNKRGAGHHARRGQLSFFEYTLSENIKGSSPDGASFLDSAVPIGGSTDFSPDEGIHSATAGCSTPATRVVRCQRSLTPIKRSLLHAYDLSSHYSNGWKVTSNKSSKRKSSSDGRRRRCPDYGVGVSYGTPRDCKRLRKSTAGYSIQNETWVQCDACRKWRKLEDESLANDASTVWFCSMNSDPLYMSCSAPEESWDNRQPITYFPGFHTKGTPGGKEENVSFFTSVLKEHFNSEAKKALTWLAKLSPDKLSEMESIGLLQPVVDTRVVSRGDEHKSHKIFQAFGLIKRSEKGTTRWYYPSTLENLVFDLSAFRIALCEPLDSLRLYLSRATLIVVPANLVDHWKTQIQKHVRPGQLRIYVWTDHKKPSAHSLAWDYDVVITTFNRLSCEWSPRNRSVLMQVHWHRVILDEGHTLGSSLNLTNKLQLAISLTATNRWLLTGTPAPNTPNSQLSHLQPLLKFLHDNAYGENQKSWEAGILKPFEAEREEGRTRLLELLCRCMISARKEDLQTIPPCIKKVTYVDFTEEHAKSYNELVVTVRRNILMADWNDPAHVESLLNPKQWKFRSNTIKNLRLSCCVAGHIKVTDAGQDIQETMDILVGNGLDPISEEYAFIKSKIQYGCCCMRCNEWCRLPVITPCRHLLCLACVAMDSERCTFPGCGRLYEMQSPEALTRPENPNPKWPVPKDLIELQPSYKQAGLFPICCTERTSGKKVIIFSQFLEHIHFAGMYSPMHACNKMKSLAMFQYDPSCMVLLMDGKQMVKFLQLFHLIETQLIKGTIIELFLCMPAPLHEAFTLGLKFHSDAGIRILNFLSTALVKVDVKAETRVEVFHGIIGLEMQTQFYGSEHSWGTGSPWMQRSLAYRIQVIEDCLSFQACSNLSDQIASQDFPDPLGKARYCIASKHVLASQEFLSNILK
ncbi:hypothetical protein RHSIM_Rhsim07G0066900 [Rhododendron simsii]|uniref:F-box protein n=1 Tax=Rhododendron simsii TaxID=118357 RepID=A0A834GLM7_RHOSS|nr:hypothetical protein RHSIM_Rhsim07G0066900 [Rhododendron simsii]